MTERITYRPESRGYARYQTCHLGEMGEMPIRAFNLRQTVHSEQDERLVTSVFYLFKILGKKVGFK